MPVVETPFEFSTFGHFLNATMSVGRKCGLHFPGVRIKCMRLDEHKKTHMQGRCLF